MQNEPVKHLAGIVPIASRTSLFNLPWHDSLMPVADDYLAIEKAVFDCALAGCDSIWVVGHMGTQPLVRKRLGEMIYDPLTIFSNKELVMKRHDAAYDKKEIQIYYVPIHPKDRDRRDSLAYSVLYGANMVDKTCERITNWLKPSLYFCSFPYGIVSEQTIYEFRKVAYVNKSTAVTWEGKTVCDNLMLPFTFNRKEMFRAKKRIAEQALSIWHESGNVTERLPSINYSIKDIFGSLDLSQASIVDCDWFHQIDNWDNYRKYLASGDSEKIKRRVEVIDSYNCRSELNFGE